MSQGDDNACDYDVDMKELSLPDEFDQFDDNCQTAPDCAGAGDNDDALEAENLMKKFAEITLKMLESENERVRSELTAYQNESQQLMEEKMSLLCTMNKPHVDASCGVKPLITVNQISKTQKDILDKFRHLFDSEGECVRAYEEHCDKTIKAKLANIELDNYDEYTDMPHETLAEHIEEIKARIESVKATTEKLRAERSTQQRENNEKYTSIMKEVETFEIYNLEALDTLEMHNFELEQLPRDLQQQIKFD